MIVGSKVISTTDLKRATYSVESLKRFAESLVPKPIRHFPQIVDNQKYLVAIALRTMVSIPFKRRTELCEGLLEGIQVRGVLTTVIDFYDLIMAADTDLLYKALFERDADDS